MIQSIKNGVNIFNVTGSFSGMVKSIQLVSRTNMYSAGSPYNVTINTVDPNCTIAFMLNHATTNEGSLSAGDCSAKVTSSTNLAVSFAMGTSIDRYTGFTAMVIEFDSAYVKSKQSGTGSIAVPNTSVATSTVTLATPVIPNNCIVQTFGAGTSWSDASTWSVVCMLTGSTSTNIMNVLGNVSLNDGRTINFSYIVLELQPGIAVQK